uniref:RING-type domain-containing protein n=1 Tax=Aplanochytrium stocchinoi TaxID=215587 RepID=A0A7S3PNQ8_9STRA
MFATKGFSYLSNLGKELKNLSQKIAGISRNRFSKGESGKEKGEDVLCKPTGLYTDCKWDEKHVRRMVIEKKIAPRWPGSDNEDFIKCSDECPICFLFYPSVNVTNCCSQLICTECYLQLQTPSKEENLCPFCCKRFTVTFSGPRSEHTIRKERKETEETLELQLGKENVENLRRLDNGSIDEIETASTKMKHKAEQEAARQSMVVEYERAAKPLSPNGPNRRDSSPTFSTINGYYPQALEDMMILEAIRNSLADQGSPRSANRDNDNDNENDNENENKIEEEIKHDQQTGTIITDTRNENGNGVTPHAQASIKTQAVAPAGEKSQKNTESATVKCPLKQVDVNVGN